MIHPGTKDGIIKDGEHGCSLTFVSGDKRRIRSKDVDQRKIIVPAGSISISLSISLSISGVQLQLQQAAQSSGTTTTRNAKLNIHLPPIGHCLQYIYRHLFAIYYDKVV